MNMFIQTIDIYGNNYYQFTDRQGNKYKVYSETIPDELKFLGDPIKNQKFFDRLKIIATNNIYQLLQMKENELKHDCCSVRRDQFWLKYPLIPKSCIQFKTFEQYKNHISMVELISNINRQDFKQHCLKIYSYNPQKSEITVEQVSQNLLEVLSKIKVTEKNDFKKNFTYMLEVMFKKMLKKIDLLVNKVQIFQTDISFQNIILTTEGKWEFLSYATAIEIDSRKKTYYLPNKKAFIFEQYQKGGSYTQQQFFDSSLKSLILVIIQAILIVYGELKEPLTELNNESIYQYLNKIKNNKYVYDELIERINVILFPKADNSLYSIDKGSIQQKFQLFDSYIKEYQQIYKFFTDSSKLNIKFTELTNNIVSPQDQLLMLNQLRLLDSESQSIINDKFITYVNSHNDSINMIKQALLSYYGETAINQMESQDHAILVDNFINRIKVNNLPDKKQCFQMLPEIFNKEPIKQANYKENDSSGVINIYERDYLIACAILKHNKNIIKVSLKVSQENFQKQNDNVFESILNAFTENNIIQHFVCSFEDVQFNQEQFKFLSHALVNNTYCQIYELNFDRTNLQTQQINELKETLNNRQFTESLFISYKGSDFKKEFNDQFSIIREYEPNTGSFQDQIKQQISQLEQGNLEVEIQEQKPIQTKLKYPENKALATNPEISITHETSNIQLTSLSQSQPIYNLNNNANDTIHKKKKAQDKQELPNVQQQNIEIELSKLDNHYNQQNAQTSKNINNQVLSQKEANINQESSRLPALQQKQEEKQKGQVQHELNSNLENKGDDINSQQVSSLDNYMNSKSVNTQETSSQKENSQLTQAQAQNNQFKIDIIPEESFTPQDVGMGTSDTSSLFATKSENSQKNQVNVLHKSKISNEEINDSNSSQMIESIDSNIDSKNFENDTIHQFQSSQKSAFGIYIEPSSIKSQNYDIFEKISNNVNEELQNIKENSQDVDAGFQNQKINEAKSSNQVSENKSQVNQQSLTPSKLQQNQIQALDNQQRQLDSGLDYSDNNQKQILDKQENSNKQKINEIEESLNLTDSKLESVNKDQQNIQKELGQVEFQQYDNKNNDLQNVNEPELELEFNNLTSYLQQKDDNYKLEGKYQQLNESFINSDIISQPQNNYNRVNIQCIKDDVSVTQETQQTQTQNVLEDNYAKEIVQQVQKNTENKTINEEKINKIKLMSSNLSQENQTKSIETSLKKEEEQQENQKIHQIIVEKSQQISNSINQDSMKQNLFNEIHEETDVRIYNQNIGMHDSNKKEFQKNDILQIKQDVTVSSDIVSVSQSLQFKNQVQQEVQSMENLQQDINRDSLINQQEIKKKEIQKSNIFAIKEEVSVTQETQKTQPQKALVDNYIIDISQQVQINAQNQNNKEEKMNINDKLISKNESKENQSKSVDISLNNERKQQEKHNISQIIIEKSQVTSNNINQDYIKQNQLYEIKEESSVGIQNLNIGMNDVNKKDFQKNKIQQIKQDVSVSQDSVSQVQSIQFNIQVQQEVISQLEIQKKDIQKNNIYAIKEEVSVTNEIDSPRQSNKFNYQINQNFSLIENSSQLTQKEDQDVSQKNQISQQNSLLFLQNQDNPQLSTLSNSQKQNMLDILFDNQSQIYYDKEKNQDQNLQNIEQQSKSDNNQIDQEKQFFQNENYSLQNYQIQQFSQQHQEQQIDDYNLKEQITQKFDEIENDENDPQNEIYNRNQVICQNSNGFNFQEDLQHQADHQTIVQDIEQQDYSEENFSN
ncbi:hypothetical protein TTHERM_00141090 (macronuclear) [Tetrahymena thermophila SB210]|uniref:Kinase domain protein n=1 Tax=Tetrahymena thermophila (strain SB210) TaxID=312017 RepID=I7MI24_TETTS|nr:hypothetical protein TTHERM_00141090 [Tetrahymena thermophila SB210]EAR90801.3 hypothetical protein TTHERM_00141090 [Tetrahymena thermophila SB210]|eukprot:XP_001011046.3 hypothetical protein TTHERM_00141090 [Tetrahymena thermophila SB210]